VLISKSVHTGLQVSTCSTLPNNKNKLKSSCPTPANYK